MADYPGFMIYLDVWKPLMSTGDATLARLVRAAVAYAETGEPPELKGRAALLWEMLRPKLDRDRQKYGNIRLRNNYANYCRIADRKGEPRLSYEDWKQLESHFSHWDPNTDANINTNTDTEADTNTKTNIKSSVSVNPAADTDADADAITAPDPKAEGGGAGRAFAGALAGLRARNGDLSVENYMRLLGAKQRT